MVFTPKELPDLKRYFRDFGMVLPERVVVDDAELQPAWEETKAQHPEETENEQLARAVARLAYKNRPRDEKLEPQAALLPVQVNVGEEISLLRDALLSALVPPRWERFCLWAWRLLVLLALWLIFWALPAHAQLDGLQIQDGAGVSLKQWAGGIAKLKCGANMTCTLSGTTITMAAGAGGSTAWDAITNPTAANLSLAHAAFTTTFTWNATTGAGVNLFNLTDTASNSGTGYLFNAATAASSALKPFRFCYRGTTDCITLDTTTLAATGAANINATLYKGGTAAGVGSCTNQAVTATVDAAAPTCNTITSAYTSGTFPATAHNLLSATHGDTTVTAAVRGSIIYANLTPAWTALGVQTANKYPKWDGTDLVPSSGAASGTGACTNQFPRTLNADAVPSCATVEKADAAATFVHTDQANTWSTGAQDFSAATSLIVKTGAGYAPTADGSLGYDTTQKATVAGGNGAVKGFFPRVLKMTNCTTEGNCTAASGGNQVGADAAAQGTTETNFASNWSMPANFLFTNKAIRVCAVFEYTVTAPSPTMTIRFKLGSTPVVTTSASVLASGQTDKGFPLCFIVQGTAAPGASVSVEAGFDGGSTNPSVLTFHNMVAQPVAAIATNGALTAQISGQWSAATTGNTIRLQQFYVMEMY